MPIQSHKSEAGHHTRSPTLEGNIFLCIHLPQLEATTNPKDKGWLSSIVSLQLSSLIMTVNYL